MKVKEIIKSLVNFNPEDECFVFADGHVYKIELVEKSNDGVDISCGWENEVLE